MVEIPSYFWVVISEWRRKRYEKKTVPCAPLLQRRFLPLQSAQVQNPKNMRGAWRLAWTVKQKLEPNTRSVVVKQTKRAGGAPKFVDPREKVAFWFG